MVRCKMALIEVTDLAIGGKRFRFQAQHDDSIPLEQRFATPNRHWGTFEMQSNNPAAIEQFKLGECYYLDMQPVPAS